MPIQEPTQNSLPRIETLHLPPSAGTRLQQAHEAEKSERAEKESLQQEKQYVALLSYTNSLQPETEEDDLKGTFADMRLKEEADKRNVSCFIHFYKLLN